MESLYPNLLINYKFFNNNIISLANIYKEVLRKRIAAKKIKLEPDNTILKLVLNSTTGMLDNTYSWLYSPYQVQALRLTGQLIMARLAEECKLHKIQVISYNTDGFEAIVPITKQKTYNNIISTIEQEFNVILESDEYKSIYYSTVNDYIAETVKGKIKVKNSFISDFILDASNEFTIIALALQNYLIHKIPIKDTIIQNNELWRFCTSQKVGKQYNVFFKGKRVNHLNRYFITNTRHGGYLYKSKKLDKMDAVLKDTPIFICNEDIRSVNVKDYPINYQWYINRTQEVIDKFYPTQLNLF